MQNLGLEIGKQAGSVLVSRKIGRNVPTAVDLKAHYESSRGRLRADEDVAADLRGPGKHHLGERSFCHLSV